MRDSSGACSSRSADGVELRSGIPSTPDPPLSTPIVAGATMAESVPTTIGTTNIEDGTQFEVPRADDVSDGA